MYHVGENQYVQYSFLIDDKICSDQHIQVQADRNSSVRIELFITNVTIKVTVECILNGSGAQIDVAGIYMLDAADKVNIVTLQHHKAAHTRSTLIMKGVLRSQAQAHYHGTVRIEKEAFGSHAAQENKNVLLSNAARAVSVPTLEVLTDDVQCSHGSAVSRFDEEHLLYAAARGIDEKKAQHLLLQAFCADVLEDEMLKKHMNSKVLNEYI